METANFREFDAYISYSHNDVTWFIEVHDTHELFGFNWCPAIRQRQQLYAIVSSI
jgi:hypothetical protein